MCDLHDHRRAAAARGGRVRPRHAVPARRSSPTSGRGSTGAARAAEACEAIRPSFDGAARATATGCPSEYQRDVPDSGMGGGIGQWLLYRAADRSLCLFSLVVPPGSMTPVHDHLAWGLIGLYRGNQDEEFYRPGDGGDRARAPAAARSPATSTRCCRRPTTSTASGRPRT